MRCFFIYSIVAKSTTEIVMRKTRKPHTIFSGYHFSNRQLILLVFLATIGVCVTWIFYEVFFIKTSDDWFESVARNSSLITLPKDDAPHHAEMEWWYYNGHLSTESGKKYSFHYTVFLINNVAHHMVSHASINDYQTGRHYTAQQRTAGNPSTSKENAFEFTQGDWLMAGSNGADQLKFNIENINLHLARLKLTFFQKHEFLFDRDQEYRILPIHLIEKLYLLQSVQFLQLYFSGRAPLLK